MNVLYFNVLEFKKAHKNNKINDFLNFISPDLKTNRGNMNPPVAYYIPICKTSDHNKFVMIYQPWLRKLVAELGKVAQKWEFFNEIWHFSRPI